MDRQSRGRSIGSRRTFLGQAMGAIINLVTRSGSNQFHGGAFYFGRNDLLNATDYFNNLNAIPKDVLRRNDWGYTFGGDTRTVDVHIRWLREKIEEEPGSPRRLETVRGVGYRFVG